MTNTLSSSIKDFKVRIFKLNELKISSLLYSKNLKALKKI